MDINEIQAFTGIDLWFLKEVQEIINYEKIIKSNNPSVKFNMTVSQGVKIKK